MEQNKLYQWVKDKYPPIDLNIHYKSVIGLVNENEALKERVKQLEEALRKITCQDGEYRDAATRMGIAQKALKAY